MCVVYFVVVLLAFARETELYPFGVTLSLLCNVVVDYLSFTSLYVVQLRFCLYFVYRSPVE